MPKSTVPKRTDPAPAPNMIKPVFFLVFTLPEVFFDQNSVFLTLLGLCPGKDEQEGDD
ncbi:hypothetical protein [Algoriphagus boritolerans]|uniref:hypothetical protein n=1 Tax=Algoriphagus boritolerans TaxID=308111 RepID=UPI002FCE086C